MVYLLALTFCLVVAPGCESCWLCEDNWRPRIHLMSCCPGHNWLMSTQWIGYWVLLGCHLMQDLTRLCSPELLQPATLCPVCKYAAPIVQGAYLSQCIHISKMQSGTFLTMYSQVTKNSQFFIHTRVLLSLAVHPRMSVLELCRSGKVCFKVCKY